ncbi:MAG: UbiA family prenyltransferase [Lunatimonas sp.]|uniref:UbiA family prenyltransferase n=1 Tax=Lunatimonas sp. TaxID=2060141 RepID=UPI00263AE032|nr:UbiA family prenyltransferase [Lunatimonas sp.]MCC5938922.1 UbiA family prenyltransferase [Lunatimonas sp.]
MKTPTTVFTAFEWPFWKAYGVQMRPYLLFVSGAAGATGIAMGSQGDEAVWKWCLAFVPFFLGYGFGQALTDCFQTDTDKLSAPYRPLSQEIISIRSVLITSVLGLFLSGLILFWLHPLSFIFSLTAVVGLSTYSYVKRHFWFGGPFYNGWIVALLPMMGYFGVRVPTDWEFPSACYGYIFLTLISYANFVLIGYLKDIEADRATNYRTFPVVYGWNKTVWVGDLFVLLALFLFWLQPLGERWFWFFGVTGTTVMVFGQVAAHLTSEKNEVGALIPIKSTVRGFILLHLAVIVQFQPDWYWIALVFYALFEWALYKRPSTYQV